MMDASGIELNSDQTISFQARGSIVIRAGRKLSIRAPRQVLLQTSQSNIELNRNFNFFALGGVRTS